MKTKSTKQMIETIKRHIEKVGGPISGLNTIDVVWLTPEVVQSLNRGRIAHFPDEISDIIDCILHGEF